jgi:hypothetical protein
MVGVYSFFEDKYQDSLKGMTGLMWAARLTKSVNARRGGGISIHMSLHSQKITEKYHEHAPTIE